MTKQEAQKRIEKLKETINRHRYLYHVLDRQEISPEALDSLKHELYKLEEAFPELITPDSPTQRVAGRPLEGFKKVEHKVPMISLEDIFSEKELQEWENYLKRLAPKTNFDYFCELKVDGFAVTLIYKNGIFVQGSTRGDGKVGEDVTQNLKTIESIPLRLAPLAQGKPFKFEVLALSEVEVRGEAYMDKADFEKFNKEQIRKGLPPFANPRNLAAGSIRQLDAKLAASRPLKFLAYDLVTDLGQQKHSEKHQIIKDLGFRTDEGRQCQNLDDIIAFWKQVSKKRESLPFQIDGIVINVDDNGLFQKLGVVGKTPRAARAFKFSPKQATTKVIDIIVQVGRTGAVTPVARLEPVEVAGVVISRATLHNEDEIKRLDIKIGDTVVVERAGDVIPHIASVLSELRSGDERKFQLPKNCPVCGSELIKPGGEVVTRCSNPGCQARKREYLHHFASKKSFDIRGLGPKIIDKLMDGNLVSRASDLFELEEGDLLPIERFAEKSVANLISAINASKIIPLSRFIYSLGIRHAGEQTAFDLAQYFGSIDKLAKANKEELLIIPNIGEVVAESIYDWFQSQRNKDLIRELLMVGIKIMPPENLSASGQQKLKGKSFILTGTLESITRNEAHKRIRMLGGKTPSSVSKLTDYLVQGQEPGSKLEKAKKLGVKIIGEKEFLALIK